MSLILPRRQLLGLMGAAASAALLPRHAQAATPFIFQASWINDAEFMGYFLGIDKGYFAAEGLNLDYLSGGPDVIPESTLITARADLTLTTPDTTIKAITEQGAPFKIIGAQYQKNPIGIISLATNPINTPQDLIGKTLAVPPVNVISIEAFLKINGITRDQVNIVPYAYDPTPLLKGEIDASLDFVTNVPFTLQQAGAEVVSFLLYDHGYTLYNDTLVVLEDTLRNRRADLVSFLRAARRGWEENFQDTTAYPPSYADSWFKGTGRSIENEVYFNTAQKPLMEAPNGLFHMTEEGIEANIRALSHIGIQADRAHFDTTLLEEL